MLALVACIIFVLALLFSMLGLGGAMLYIPVLHWFGFDFKSVAIPTGLLLNGITALSASVYYLRARLVDTKGSVPLILSSFIGAPVGALFTRYLPTNALIGLFAAAMLVAAWRMIFSSNTAGPGKAMSPVRKLALMGGGGFFIGFIAGLLGVGGGFLFVPMMMAMGYKTKEAAATSAFVVVFSSFSGFAGHVAEGHYEWPLMLATLVAVVVGSQVGARLMHEKMKEKWIKQMFAVVLIGVAAKLIWKLML